MLNNRTSTKQKLLNILKREHECTIKEIMVHFEISEIAVRRHLRDLISQDFIRDRTVKQDIGRPYHVYALTDKGHLTFPNQYEELPIQLLHDLEEIQGRKAVRDLLLKRKEREQAEFESLLGDRTFDDKVKKIIERQNERGYMIEYEKTEQGNYEIKNFNCPIYNIASNYGQICNNEKDMYRHLFQESEVVAESCMTKGGTYCCWVISKPED